MIKAYIKDNKIVKVVAYWFYSKEWEPEHDSSITADFNITDNVKYENWAVVLDDLEQSNKTPRPQDI